MIKQTLTYEDFSGNKVTEDFYFHLAQHEVIELNLSEGDSKTGLEGYIQRIVAQENNMEIFRLFKKIIQASYGVRSADGKTFTKKNEHGVPLGFFFESHPAFDELVVSLFDAEKAATFIAGLLPANMGKSLEQITEPAAPPSETWKGKDPKDMSREEMLEAFKDRMKDKQ